MDDAVAVALKVIAVGMREFREAASAGMFHLHRVSGEHSGSLTGRGLVPSTECKECNGYTEGWEFYGVYGVEDELPPLLATDRVATSAAKAGSKTSAHRSGEPLRHPKSIASGYPRGLKPHLSFASGGMTKSCPSQYLPRCHYCFSDSSFARRTFAASSFFCVAASRSPSTSELTVLFHSATARSQCAAASFRRPVFW